MGHIIMEIVKIKRFDYTTSPIVEYYGSKRCKAVKTYPQLLHQNAFFLQPVANS